MSQAIAVIWSWTAGLGSRSGAVPWAWVRLDRRFNALAVSLAITVLLTLYFWILPSADLAVTAGFHSLGAGFPLSDLPALKALRKSSSWVLAVIVLTALGGLVAAARRDGWAGLALARRAWCVLAGLALGPGLLVNLVLKGFWGRPRPVQTELFGGDAPYVAPWHITDWCAGNCSFVSGEGASAAWMVAAVALAPEPWRRLLLTPMATYAVALSMNRVAFGAHFLSDIVLSWSLTAVVMSLLYALLTAPAFTAASAARVVPIRS
jgi:hypothetical protein